MALQHQIHGKELLRVNVAGQKKNIVVLRGNSSIELFEAHPLVEGFNAEHGTNLKVVSYNVADVAETVGETWRSLSAYAVDASIAYEKLGTKLGKEIVFAAEGEPRIILETGKYKGEKDVALVAQGLSSADFKREGNSIFLDIKDDRLVVVKDFPSLDGWYMPHPETGVPTGGKVDHQSPAARYLWTLNASYVSLLVRGAVYVGRRGVFADLRSSGRFWVVAEVPVLDIPKIEGLLKPLEVPKTDEKTRL